MANENQPINPDNPEHDPLMDQNPEYEAGLAYRDLDKVIGDWVRFHPGVTEEDVDAAYARFKLRLRERDEGQDPPQR